MKKLIQRLMTLFAGNEATRGTHGMPEQDDDGVKWGIKRTAKTLPGAANEKHWLDHVEGRVPLGVSPVMEGPEGLCRWGSVDIDDYDVDVAEVIKKVESAKLPLVPCRSKSGGLHLFLFAKDPVPSSLMQSTLRDIAASLGYSKSEIFPKQTRLVADRGEKGSWMVMPYFGGDFGGKLRMQHGLKKTGSDMTLTEFLDYAEKHRIDPATISTVRAKKPKTERPPFSDGPPCLVHLASAGVTQGGQNNTLLQMGIYFKRAFPDKWKEKLEEANGLFCRPPHPAEGVSSVIKSLEKKDYQYKCKDQPMESHCDALLCRTRKFGVGAGGTYPVITWLGKLESEPVVWFVEVENTKFMCSTEELQTYGKFHRLCMEKTNKTFAPLSQAVWFSLLSDAMAPGRMESIEVPPDMMPGAAFRGMLETFLTNRQRGKDREDLLSGRPWENEEQGRHIFQQAALVKFLIREGVKDPKWSVIKAEINRMGGGHDMIAVKKGVTRNVWWIPSEVFQTQPEIAIPKTKEETI